MRRIRQGALSNSDRKVLVWDAPTRLFHWLTVVLVLAAYVTWRLNWMDWHAKAGDAVLTLLLFRLLWGFFGSETTRFFRFVASPRAAARHLACVLRREPDRQAGHNAAGGWMVLLLLVLSARRDAERALLPSSGQVAAPRKLNSRDAVRPKRHIVRGQSGRCILPNSHPRPSAIATAV